VGRSSVRRRTLGGGADNSALYERYRTDAAAICTQHVSMARTPVTAAKYGDNQLLAKAATGIFVAFEENIDAIFANAAVFDWGLPALARKRLFFMNAQLSPAFVATGDFDLGGMLAMLEAKQLEIGAQWV